jgi:AraC-like DNA-binding protein
MTTEDAQRSVLLIGKRSLPVQAVAAEVGFASQFYFATRFKKLTGLSPSAFRAQPPRSGPDTVARPRSASLAV